MEFILKKIVSLFLMPLSIGIGLMILALIFLYLGKIKKTKYLLAISISWLFLFSYPPFVNPILHKLENNYPTLQKAPQNTKYIYVLGGGHATDDTQPITSQVNPTSVVRLIEGIRLLNQLDNVKLIVSGYSGLFDPTSHAIMQSRLAISLGIDKERIIILSSPKDTKEEALEAKRVIKDNPFILVTSASHITRAMKIFHSQNLYPIPAPTNHLTSIKIVKYSNILSTDTLLKSRIMFHEFIGMLWLKIRG